MPDNSAVQATMKYRAGRNRRYKHTPPAAITSATATAATKVFRRMTGPYSGESRAAAPATTKNAIKALNTRFSNGAFSQSARNDREKPSTQNIPAAIKKATARLFHQGISGH